MFRFMPTLLAFFVFLGTMATVSVDAKVLPTGPEVRAFLGGRTGKLIYVKTFDHKLYFVNFDDSVLVERKVSDDVYVLNPKISPDGSRVVYESYGTIWVRELVGNSTQRIAVMSAPFRSGYFYEPHWWVHPTTGDEYILWSTGEVAFADWPPSHEGAGTYLRRIRGTEVDSAITTLLPFTMGGGRSRDGKWGATANHTTGMFRLSPEKISYAFLEAKNWLNEGAYLSCNPTISPSKDPARMSRLLHLTSGFGTLQGKTYDNHKAVIMRSWDDPSLDSPTWYMGPLGDKVDDDSSGNVFWHYPEWSNDEDYFTVVGSTIIENWDTADVYLIKINLAGNSKPLRVIQGGGINVVPDLWVKDGVQPARLRLDRNALRFVSLRQDSVAPPAQEIKVSNAGDGTLPPLKIGPLPKWLKVTLTGNGSNAPVIRNEVLRDSLNVGEYRATVAITYGGGVDSIAYTVDFSYRDPVLTTLKPKPARLILVPGQTLQLGVTPLDQMGSLFELPADGKITWSSPEGLLPLGALNPPAGARAGLTADGRFTADTSLAAPYGFMAIGRYAGSNTSDTVVACTTEVRVARRYLLLDAGKQLAPPNEPIWIARAPGQSGRRLQTLPAAVNIATDRVIDPAPDSLYRTFERMESFENPGLPKGRYRVRLHGIVPGETDTTAASLVSVKLEGRTAFESRFPVQAVEKTWHAVVAEAQVTVSDNDGLLGEFTAWGTANQADTAAGFYVAAIEVYDLGLPPVTVTAPNGNETFNPGDTVRIRWQTDGFITSVGIQVSLDSGKKWIPLTRTASVEEGEEAWGNYAWVVPDSLDGLSLLTGQAMVSVYDYFGSDRDRSDGVFAIKLASASLRPGGAAWARLAPFAAHWQAGLGLRVQGLQPGLAADLALLNVRGQWQAWKTHQAVSAQGEVVWQVGSSQGITLPTGAYRLLVRQNGRMQSAMIWVE